MYKFIKKLLNNNNNISISTLENKEMITKELPLFSFSKFSNHTMIDVVIVPVSKENDKIKLYLTQDIMDLIDFNMDEHFHIRFKSHSNIIINGTNKSKIEIPANHLQSIHNYSMGALTVKQGVEIQEKIINEGSGDISVHSFTGNVIKNESMGKLLITNINTNSLKLCSNGSGNVEIINGHIDTLNSHTNSMGKVSIKSDISSATVTSNGSGNTYIGNVSNDIDINLKSMGSVEIEGESQQKLKAYCDGSGKLVINSINTQNLDIDLNSMGSVEINGYSVISKLHSSGSGSIKGKFTSLDININMSSMGSIEVEPLKAIKAHISGMGSLHLSGEHILDNVEAHLSSMGKVKGGNITTYSLSLSGNTQQCDIEIVSPSRKMKM